MIKIYSQRGNQVGCELILDFEMKHGAQDSSISTALLLTIACINLRSVCNSGLVRMWSGVKNIHYHQILAHPLNEATTAPCVKGRRLFLILETHWCQQWEDAGASCSTQPTVRNKQNWQKYPNISNWGQWSKFCQFRSPWCALCNVWDPENTLWTSRQQVRLGRTWNGKSWRTSKFSTARLSPWVSVFFKDFVRAHVQCLLNCSQWAEGICGQLKRKCCTSVQRSVQVINHFDHVWFITLVTSKMEKKPL